jgi:hypothetical protein
MFSYHELLIVGTMPPRRDLKKRTSKKLRKQFGDVEASSISTPPRVEESLTYKNT